MQLNRVLLQKFVYARLHANPFNKAIRVKKIYSIARPQGHQPDKAVSYQKEPEDPGSY
jgi:hypothetical protein